MYSFLVKLASHLLNSAANEKSGQPTSARTKQAVPLLLHEAAGQLADKYNLSCEPYRAPVMTADEAESAGLSWVPLDKVGTARIRGYRGNAEMLRIPRMIDGLRITEIGFNSLSNQPSFKKVYIPDSVERIEDCAFWGCENLDFVRIPNRTLTYSADVFGECPMLLKPEIRERLAEESCRNLALAMAKFHLDNQTAYQGGEMERAPYDEAVYYVANGLVNLGCFDYRGEGTEEIVRIPQKIGNITVTEITSHAFSEKNYVRRIYIPDTVKRICAYAFRDCPNLEYIRIPDNPDLVFEENVIVNCPKLLK